MFSETAGMTRSTLTFVKPSLRDPRFHLASTILTLHVLGQTVLDFRVSAVNIAAAILTCGVIEFAAKITTERTIAIPASAMLTGSGIGLILRLPEATVGDPWAVEGTEIFVLVSALAMATKFVIRQRGVHVLNPSNAALVAVFLILGSTRVEPLDFWWGPLDSWMLFAYAVILVGGLLINGRLDLLPLVVSFWGTLAVGVGILALAGQCITTPWSLHPICGAHFWWIVVTSPETLVFAFFMISDPRTIPSGAANRRWFGVALGATSAVLIAPAETEFGAKVGLLGGLLVCSVVRAGVRAGLVRLPASGTAPTSLVGPVVAWAVAILLLGATSQPLSLVDAERLPDATGVVPAVDPSTLPVVTIDESAVAFDPTVLEETQGLAARFAWLLEVEAEAVRQRDPELIRAVTHGTRRDEMLKLIESASAGLSAPIDEYEFESLHLHTIRSGSQGGVRLAFSGHGRIATTDASDSALHRAESFALTFVLLGASGDRWFLVDVAEIE